MTNKEDNWRGKLPLNGWQREMLDEAWDDNGIVVLSLGNAVRIAESVEQSAYDRCIEIVRAWFIELQRTAIKDKEYPPSIHELVKLETQLEALRKQREVGEDGGRGGDGSTSAFGGGEGGDGSL